MLTSKDVALIRAALQFWQDEMSSAGAAAFRGYLDITENIDDLNQIDISRLCSNLKRMQIRYGHYDIQTGRLLQTDPYRNFEVAEQEMPYLNAIVATILICPASL
ncbi:hypothetical protein [Thalassoglobus polymorphus]|uniref:Uncharacterized protein n=1 Tax=Thalassoglobus polymorphus TaxID=2527994 RepID=A0A517QK46_9PLAN|nr:hypothetical protein [Thalassoglobus polymorphus]QDT32008.1 hypothetical protein Mal48_12470 [Thalassoglobus polymorphus]